MRSDDATPSRRSHFAECPFCGARSPNLIGDFVPNTQCQRKFIRCLECHAQGPWSTKLIDEETGWDTRAPRSETPRSELADELERLGSKVTAGPWAWDQRGEKINEWALGVAFDADDKPLAGHFDDEDAQYVEQVCQTEGATVNYDDPKLICALRNNLSEIIAALRGCASSAMAALLPLPKVIGPVTEMVQEISALCGDMEGTETNCEVVSCVLNAAKRYQGGERAE